MTRGRFSFWAVATAMSFFLVTAPGCSAPGGPGSQAYWNTGSTSGSQTTDAGNGGDVLEIRQAGLCTPPRASETLTPRVDTTGIAPPTAPMGAAPTRVIHTSEVFDRFNSACGQCHVAPQQMGDRQTSAATFATTVDSTWVAIITSDDPATAMPPENKAYSSRPANDPVRVLVSYLQAWIAAGRPTDSFALDDPASAPATSGSFSYGFTSDMASTMSNLGTCVPDKASYANSPSTEMESKDAMFAAATELPRALSDTDLVTFDSSVLASNGVIAFVPEYPLWSDGSGKLRYIRVPKGSSVKFDKATQTFDIPPNTRFYKTFFRKVKDIAGQDSYRKIETRLIVARPDQIGPDGTTIVQTALFGTYLWTDDETGAFLHDTTYRDGTPFTDKTLEYVTDELLYDEVLASVPSGSSAGFDDRLATQLEPYPGLVQHLAVPGRIRCQQCHQGSPTNNFVLGFFPLQIARQPDGTAGAYEPTGADELTQLQRLIDYGVITGMDSPADVVALEQSQTPRHARTHQEVAAQAYMVGNCAHCHNPRGYPSIIKPDLAPVLNFMPSRGQDGGGVFEFPLTRMSPIRSRGANHDVPMPYITPSLRDYPVVNDQMVRMDTGTAIDGTDGSEKTWSPKYDPTRETGAGSTPCASNTGHDDFCGDRRTGHTFVAAPWRSLIYRNVDAPFPYYDDYVPFPHMPMNTAGYDYRAPRLMGDWMVSIPSVRVDQSPDPGHGEDDVPRTDAQAHDGSYDDSAQPYVEVKPGDPAYPQSVIAAQARLAEYHTGIRYNYREEVLGTDILDEIPTTTGGPPDPREYRPNPTRYLYAGIPPHNPDTGLDVFPAIGVPYHSHWFDYDPTDNSDDWQPRRGTAWKGVLVDGLPDRDPPLGIKLQDFNPDDKDDKEMQARIATTAALAKAALTDALRTYATTPIPYGLWMVKPECKAKLAAAGIPKVSDLSGTTSAPWWIANWDKLTQSHPELTPLSPDAPVYMASPGQELYRHICFNCHGPKADGKGLQGDALAAASEGNARPANFIAGLFGPVDHPGDNLLRVFGGVDQATVVSAEVTTTAEQLAARYMAWMALGGTLQKIPLDIIHQIEATRILGVSRPPLQSFGSDFGVSANMLNLAKGICALILPGSPEAAGNQFGQFGQSPTDGYPLFSAKKSPLISSNGDFEMWVRLCSQFNPRAVIRVYSIIDRNSGRFSGGLTPLDVFQQQRPLVYADGYPNDAPVWDQNKQIQLGVDPTHNFYPACLALPPEAVDPTDVKAMAMEQEANALQKQQGMPACPKDFLDHAQALSADDADAWILNGAISAGMAVFSYLRDPDTDLAHKPAPPYYDECQLLP